MDKRLKILFVKDQPDIANLDDRAWKAAVEIAITRSWSGEIAPQDRHFTARLLWSSTAFYVRFEARQHEELIVNHKPEMNRKTEGLWDRDVCEIFIAPRREHRNNYFEFEIAPTGEWIDLKVEVTSAGRLTDWDYVSNMESAARIENNLVIMAIKIPFVSLGETPKTGDVWLGNLCRCIGKDPDRGYLAWRPTKTERPSFHVPEKFGEFEFVE